MIENTIGKKKWLGFIQIALLYILQNMDAYLLIPNYNLIKMDLGVSDAYLGIITGGYLFFNGLAALAWSYASDARGMTRKLLLASSFIAGGILTITVSLSVNPIEMAFLWILAGGTLGAIIPLGFSLISDLFEKKVRTSIFMLWYTLGGVGLAIGYGLSLFLGVIYNWRYPIYVGGLLLLLLGAPICLLIWEPPKGFSDINSKLSNKGDFKYPYRFKPEDLGLIISNKSNIYVALQGILGTIPNGVLFTWTVHYIIREAHASEVAASVFLGIMSTGALGGLLLSFLADKLYEFKYAYRPILAGFCSVTESILFIIFFSLPLKINIQSDDPVEAALQLFSLIKREPLFMIAFITFFIAMFFNSPVGAIRNSVLSDVNLPEHRATVLAGVNIAELFAKSLGITLVGLLSDIIGNLRIPIVITMFVWVFSGTAWFMLSSYYEKDLTTVKNTLEERLKGK